MSVVDLDALKGWIGRTETASDDLTLRLAALFRATLHPHLAPADGAAPLGLHWCLAPPQVATRDLSTDGHPARGGFLPPVPLPRRMWAGGEITFLAPLHIGDTVERRSKIVDLRLTEGRSGPLCFVTVEHEVATDRGMAIRERQDIVYREAPQGTAPPVKDSVSSGAPPAADLAWTVDAAPPLLFRYSALTFNSHRIHYDLPYAREQEGYPDLVVHGPLQATLLLNLAAAFQGRSPRRFRYRGLAPLFSGRPLHLRAVRTASGVDCWSTTDEEIVGMKAAADW